MSSKTKVRNHHFVWLHELAEKGKELQSSVKEWIEENEKQVASTKIIISK